MHGVSRLAKIAFLRQAQYKLCYPISSGSLLNDDGGSGVITIFSWEGSGGCSRRQPGKCELEYLAYVDEQAVGALAAEAVIDSDIGF